LFRLGFFFLVEYYSCTRVHCDIYKVLTIYLNYPLHLSSFSSLPLLRTISAGFTVLFSYMNTKYSHHTCPPHRFPMLYPLPLVSAPRQDRSFVFFLKDILLVYDSYAGGFVVTFPYIIVLYSELAYPLHSPFYPRPLLMVYTCM
jgi:hypothetical protein